MTKRKRFACWPLKNIDPLSVVGCMTLRVEVFVTLPCTGRAYVLSIDGRVPPTGSSADTCGLTAVRGIRVVCETRPPRVSRRMRKDSAVSPPALTALPFNHHLAHFRAIELVYRC